MKKIHKHSCGIDIGSRKVFVAVEGKEVVSYDTFTSGFVKLAQYLKSNQVFTVAMEATGVYWVILYDILVEAGFEVWLVDGRQTRQVPGRKTDVKDCQWIQELHSFGLLNRCFVAEGHLKELRSYQRMREDHIRSSSMHVNHMQKSLIEMNIRLPEVLNQIHGASGMAIIKSILKGERNPEKLLSLCHGSIKKNKSEQVLKALEGFYTQRGIFALKQSYEAYNFYQEQIKECDAEMSKILIEKNGDAPLNSPEQRKAIRHNKPEINNLGSLMLNTFSGKDATVLPGITDYSWLQIYSETGGDLSKWATEKHFTSWLGLSPGQHDSGKTKKNKRKGRPKAGQIFRQMAHSLLNSKNNALGAFAKRLRGRKGPAIAIKATARKLAVQYWRLMVKGSEYVEIGVSKYEEILKSQKQKYLTILAKELDIELSIKPKNNDFDHLLNCCKTTI